MPYQINGTQIAQPEEAEWLQRDQLGTDGNGHPIYPSVRQFRMRWGVMSLSDFDQIRDFFESQGATGTSVVDLPEWINSTWTFFSYSGCVLREPERGRYFTQTVTDVTLLVTNIQT